MFLRRLYSNYMITSKQNSFIKEIRSLKDKKQRDALNLFVAEGVKSVNDAFFSGAHIVSLIGTEKGLYGLDSSVLAKRVETVTEEVFSSLSGEVSPQGVLAVIEKPEQKAPQGSALLLDGVSDPANVGAIIRSAAAFGIQDVYLINGADPFSPKSVRASMGGIFRVNVIYGEREEILNKINLPLIVADMKGVDCKDFSFSGDFCLVIGNEGKGVSKEIKKLASLTISIPMQNDMESLNAAVSAGILMYQLKVNRR